MVTALIGAPFGVEGLVKLQSLSGETDHLFQLDSMILRKEGREQRYFVEELIPLGRSMAIKFAGINSPEQARLLGGAEVLVSRDKAAALGENEWYVEDLRGLSVIAEDATVQGRIIGIVEGGGGNLLEVERAGGGSCFVPFRDEFIGDINVSAGTVLLLQRWILE